MPDINDFNLLNTPDAAIPHPIAIGQRPIYRPPNGLNTLASGLAQGLQQGQQMNIDRQKAALMQQQLQLQQQMAPADIALKNAQAQQAQNQAMQYQYQLSMMRQLAQAGQGGQPQAQGMIPQGQSAPPSMMQGMSQSGLPQGSVPMNAPSPDGSGYQPTPQQSTSQQPQLTIGQPGSSDAYDQSVVNIYKKMGQPDMAMTYLKAKQDLLKATIENDKAAKDMSEQELKNKYDHLQKAGKIGFILTNLPDDQAVRYYNEQYGKIMKNIDTNAPNPGSNPKEILAYLHAAAGAALDIAESVKTNPQIYKSVIPDTKSAKDFVKTATTKNTDTAVQNAQDLVTQRIQEYQDAVKQYGENSDPAKQAKFAIQTAQNDLIKTTTPSLGQGLLAPSAPGISSGVTPSLKNKNVPQVTAPPGRVIVKNAQGQVGHIPASQLQDAIKAGYTLAQ